MNGTPEPGSRWRLNLAGAVIIGVLVLAVVVLLVV